MAVSRRIPGEPAGLDGAASGETGKTAPSQPALSQITPDTDPLLCAPSPARHLQESLVRSLEAVPATTSDSGRWSARRSLAFIVAASALLWLGIISGVTALLGA